jgi:hypothetical protein
MLLLLLLQVQDLQLRIQHEEQERLDLKRKADDKEERAAKVRSPHAFHQYHCFASMAQAQGR